MTITQNASDPLVVVVGVTGNQGGSVVKALAESDKPYRIRGLTRDVTKLAAREFAAQGVEMVSISLSADNADAVKKVFEGANVVFVGGPFSHSMHALISLPGRDELLGAPRREESMCSKLSREDKFI
jgi:saccharopine dehydrogenase-like NADP-dependent oxidoreductase